MRDFAFVWSNEESVGTVQHSLFMEKINDCRYVLYYLACLTYQGSISFLSLGTTRSLSCSLFKMKFKYDHCFVRLFVGIQIKIVGVDTLSGTMLMLKHGYTLYVQSHRAEIYAASLNIPSVHELLVYRRVLIHSYSQISNRKIVSQRIITIVLSLSCSSAVFLF